MTINKELREEFKDKEFAHGYLDEFLNVFIASQIKVLREQCGMTQQQLAEAAGMKQERISVLENVNYSSWSINTLRKLAKAFDVSLRVSFETFGNRLKQVENLDKLSLQRISRADEIKADEKADAAYRKIKDLSWGMVTIAGTAARQYEIQEQINKINSSISSGTAVVHLEEARPRSSYKQVPMQG